MKNLREAYLAIYENQLDERMDPEERALRRAEVADRKASRMDPKSAKKYADSEGKSADREDKKSKGKHIHGMADSVELDGDLVDEGTAGDVAARAQKLARQRTGQTPERRDTYKNLAKKASERENPSPSGRDLNNRSNMTSDFRRSRRGQSDWNIEHDKPGTVTKNPKKLRKQKAMGEIGEQVDIYDIILSHLLDEGYAETPEAAEVIMVNMSEDWRESIVEEMFDEGAAGAVAARAQQLANQRKNQTPKRKEMYQNLAKQAGQRERGPHQRGDNRTGMTSSERERRRDAAAYHSDLHGETKNTYGKGGVTKNPKKLRKQRALGEIGEEKDNSYLETDMNKRRKNNEKAVEDMKKTKAHDDMVKAARKHFEETDLEEKKGLWDNIHAKRKRGEIPAKPGEKGYPKTLNVEELDRIIEGIKQARKNVGASKCWDGKKLGNPATKMKGGKEVPNCVPEETILERELDPTEKAEKERIVKGMKKSAAGFKARYGKRAKSVMYATATARAKERMDTSKSDLRYGVER